MDGGIADYINLIYASSFPLWLITLLSFFAAAIPCFAIFYLGLKLLVPNLQRMSWVIKVLLILLWLVSLVILTAIGIRQAMDFSENGEVTMTQPLNIKSGDTLTVKMDGNRQRNTERFFDSELQINHDENGRPYAVYQDIRIHVKNSSDSTAYIEVERHARGFNSSSARTYAEDIAYTPTINEGELVLPSLFRLGENGKFRDQRVQISLYLPEGATLLMNQNTQSFQHRMGYSSLIEGRGQIGHYLTLNGGKLQCEDCEQTYKDDEGWEYNSSEGDDYQSQDSGETYDYDKAIRRKQQATHNKGDKPDTLEIQQDTINK